MPTAHRLTEKIIQALARGPKEKGKLRDEVVGKKFTLQGFYKALAQLREQEIVSVHQGAASLSIIWLERERERIEKIAEAYNLSGYHSYFGRLKQRQKITLRFKTLRELDLFWTQAALIAVESAYKDSPILSFLPHDYFDVVRPSTSEIWFRFLGKKNPHANVITHASREERHLSEHPGMRIENMFGENPLKQKESLYLTIAGDLIFEATLDEAVLPGIRRAMQGEKIDTAKLAEQKGAFKLTLRRDAAKALELKKKAQKYFSTKLFSTKN